jgi:hypothetical protein
VDPSDVRLKMLSENLPLHGSRKCASFFMVLSIG